MIKNKLYINQFYLLAFISIVTFKVGMLPSLISSICLGEGIVVMGIMMAIELMMLIIVYSIITRGSLFELTMPKWLKNTILTLIFFSLSIKFLTFSGEGCLYIKDYLFEGAPLLYIILPLFLTVTYLAYKGITNIAKTAEIMLVIIVFALVFNILFANIDIEGDFIKNISVSKDSAIAIDRYIIWFGDFTPFLLASVVKPKKGKVFKALCMGGIIAIPILLEMAFVAIFKEGGEFIEYAFSKLAVYNRFSFLLGTFDIPTIISFLVSMIIKLSIMLFAMIEIVAHFIKKREISTLITLIIFMLLSLFINTKERILNMATSFLRYIVLGIEYLSPMVIFITIRCVPQKDVDLSSRLQEVQNA